VPPVPLRQSLVIGRASADPENDMSAKPDAQAPFQFTASRYRERAQTNNERIEFFNLLVPVAMLQRHRIRVSADLVRFRESWLLALSALSQSYEPGPRP
jgi:hypothetical protein